MSQAREKSDDRAFRMALKKSSINQGQVPIHIKEPFTIHQKQDPLSGSLIADPTIYSAVTRTGYAGDSLSNSKNLLNIARDSRE
jgi:hypothetical protein